MRCGGWVVLTHAVGQPVMRVLCTCLPGFGHFLPMLPLARALTAAGHDVAFASAADFCPQMEREGFVTFPAGISLADQLAEAAKRYPEQHAMPHGLERFYTFVPRMLAGVAAPPRAADLMPVVEEWHPDVVVHDEADFGAPVAAAAHDVPYADHGMGVFRPLHMARLAAEVAAPLWQRFGVDLGPYGGLFRHLYLDVCPPSLQSAEIGQVKTARPMQSAHIVMGDQRLPDWMPALRLVPTIYVTLGTIFNQNPRVFTTVLESLRDQDCNVIVTVGPENDPAVLGPQPDHVHVERFIPQEALLPHCDLVINQGGTAILSILAQGLPLLVLPQGANQFFHAQACLRAGVARVLNPGEITIDAVRRDVDALLTHAEYTAAARRIAAEIDAMPGPDGGVRLLEVLVAEGRAAAGEAVTS